MRESYIKKNIKQSREFAQKKKVRYVYLALLIIINIVLWSYIINKVVHSPYKTIFTAKNYSLPKVPQYIVCKDYPDFDNEVGTSTFSGCDYWSDDTVLGKVSENKDLGLPILFLPNASSTIADKIDEMGFQDIVRKFKISRYDLYGLFVKNDSESEIYIKDIDNTNISDVAIVNVSNDKILDTIDNLTIFLDKMKENQAYKNISNFDYIDMRYLPNVYYKLTKNR